jgi:hypothetical protein
MDRTLPFRLSKPGINSHCNSKMFDSENILYDKTTLDDGIHAKTDRKQAIFTSRRRATL